MAGRGVDYTYYIYYSRYPWVADVRSLNDEVCGPGGSCALRAVGDPLLDNLTIFRPCGCVFSRQVLLGAEFGEFWRLFVKEYCVAGKMCRKSPCGFRRVGRACKSVADSARRRGWVVKALPRGVDLLPFFVSEIVDMLISESRG